MLSLKQPQGRRLSFRKPFLHGLFDFVIGINRWSYQLVLYVAFVQVSTLLRRAAGLMP